MASRSRDSVGVLLTLDVQSVLEFELRLQQYIELRRHGKILEAKKHAQKYIIPQIESRLPDAHRAAGIMAYPPTTTTEPYRVCETIA